MELGHELRTSEVSSLLSCHLVRISLLPYLLEPGFNAIDATITAICERYAKIFEHDRR